MKRRIGFYEKYMKRALDFGIAFFALLLLSPVFILIALLIKLTLPGPVLFVQERPGLQETIFKLYKFKTMKWQLDSSGKLLPDSQRMTRLGRFLRHTSLDELPELINVIKGDMSIIGPRPLLTRYLPYYNVSERLRHTARPGITGLAQINGRNSLNWDARLALDVQYVNRICLTKDCYIFMKSILKVLKREGALEVDLAPIQDLDVERMQQLKIYEIDLLLFEQCKADIRKLLIDVYITNFLLASEDTSTLCEDKMKALENYIKDGSARLFGCFDQGKVIGLIWLYLHKFNNDMRAHINQLVVSPKYRSKGIGKRLMSAAEKKAIELGATAIDLYVLEKNEAAQKPYQELGFTTEKRYMMKKL